MASELRRFEDVQAVREKTPLLIGLAGPSSSGKTFSALRMATGIQRVVGGEIFVIDTEAKRATHYTKRFKFRHVDFQPPFGPLDYLAAIKHCVSKGAGVLVIDSMTHEHSGEGGVMDQSERYLEQHCGDDWKKRERMLMLSLVRPKSQRKRLNASIVQLGINAILCYRAADKIKPVRGGEPIKLGWQPETTSPLHYDMVQRFLLTPGCDGVPSLNPEHQAEKELVKNPDQFRGWFKSGEPLSEELGERMAMWAAGESAADSNGAERPGEEPGNFMVDMGRGRGRKRLCELAPRELDWFADESKNAEVNAAAKAYRRQLEDAAAGGPPDDNAADSDGSDAT